MNNQGNLFKIWQKLLIIVLLRIGIRGSVELLFVRATLSHEASRLLYSGVSEENV